jgi:hypothetical protein
MFEKACFPPRTAGRGKTPFETAHASASTSLEGRPADHLVAAPRHGARTAYISADRWRIPPPPRTTSSTRPPPPSAYTHGGRGRGGSSGDAQADMPSGQASGATCVQNLDDSRNSAIHTTYRVSLRSSSLREPRYPLLRVVCYSSRFPSPAGGPRARARAPGGGEGRLRLARSNMVRGASAGRKPDSRPPPPAGRTGRERAELAPEAGKANEASRPPRTGGPHASEARPRGPLPARTRTPGGRKRVRRDLTMRRCNGL